MKRSSHAWLLYALCLLVIVPAMVWLSVQILAVEKAREESHRETELARQSAELQERISSALWRMDGMLMPLVAQEASRPHYVYDSFYDPRDVYTERGMPEQKAAKTVAKSAAQGYGDSSPTPSPLLVQPSHYIVLNFEAGPDGQLRSPQVPDQAFRQDAYAAGYTDTALRNNSDCLENAKTFFSYSQVLSECPVAPQPNEQVANLYLNTNQIGAQQQKMQQAVPTAETSRGLQPSQSGSSNSEPIAQTKPQGRGGYGKISDWQRSRNSKRGNDEFAERAETVKSQSYNLWTQNRLTTTPSPFVREGVMKALWLDDNLVLARRVTRDQSEVIQCCWLDWKQIESELERKVADLLPNVELVPVRNDNDVRPGLALAALPAQISVDNAKLLATLNLNGGELEAAPRSGLKLGLGIAWVCLGITAVASAVLLNGVLKLNERRSAFVSAVTHELRTPLTTFRMYAEMLAERMVPTVEKQQEYAQTLKVEADRLAHLVENILQFARLERGGNHNDLKETLTVAKIFDRFTDRLHERAAQANMQVEITFSPAFLDQSIVTTPSAFEQVIFNLVDNACKYARDADDRRIQIRGERQADHFHFHVRDHGPGVEDAKRKQLFMAFRKSDQDSANTAQGVGLGLALCRRIAKALGGSLELTRKSPGAEFLLKLPAQR